MAYLNLPINFKGAPKLKPEERRSLGVAPHAPHGKVTVEMMLRDLFGYRNPCDPPDESDDEVGYQLTEFQPNVPLGEHVTMGFANEKVVVRFNEIFRDYRDMPDDPYRPVPPLDRSTTRTPSRSSTAGTRLAASGVAGRIRRLFGNEDSDLESEDDEDDHHRSSRETSVIEESAVEDSPIGVGAESDARAMDVGEDVGEDSEDEMLTEHPIPVEEKGEGSRLGWWF